MEDLEFSLVKKKIIKMNDVIKILADKNHNLNRLTDKLKILYFKYREKSSEASALRSNLEMCKLELEPLRNDYTKLLSKHAALEDEHKHFVNNSEIKYQMVCVDLNNITQKYNSAMSNLTEDCKTCESQTERNVSLSKEVISLKLQLDNLQNDVHTAAQRRNIDLNNLEDHKKELETLKIQHAMELQWIESRHMEELENKTSRIKYLETGQSALNEQISTLKDRLNTLNKKSPNLMQFDHNGTLQCDIAVNTPDLDRYDLHWDCSGSDYEEEVINKYISECKYLPTLLSPIDGDKLSMECETSTMIATAESGEILAEKIAIPYISSKDIQDATTKKQDINDCCIADVTVSYAGEELENTTIAIITEDNVNSACDTLILPDCHLNTPDIQSRLLKRKAQKAKQMRHRRLKQNLLKTLFKYVDKKLMLAKSYALADHNHKRKNQNMSQSYRNKRKLQMIRWKYLREVCFSSTDSEHDSRIVRHRIKTRSRKEKTSGKQNLMKLIRKVNENYDNLTSGFDDLSKYYDSLNVPTSNGHNENQTSVARIDTTLTLNTIHIDDKVQTDSPDSGYSGKSDTDHSNLLSSSEEKIYKNKFTSKSAINDINDCDNQNFQNVSSQCTDTVVKLHTNIDLEVENVNTESVLCRKDESNSDHITGDGYVGDNNYEIGKNEQLKNDVCLETIESDNIAHKPDKKNHDCYEANNKISIPDKQAEECVFIDSVHYEMKNIKESGKKLHFSTNILKESTAEDVSLQHCSKKRISHYNKIKSVGGKRQKLLENSSIGSNINQKVILPLEQNNQHNYEEIYPTTNVFLKTFDITTICEKIDMSNIKPVEKDKQCKMVKLNLNVDMSSPTCSSHSKISTNIPSHSNSIHLRKIITFPDENTIFAEVVSAMSTQDSDSVIRCVLQEVSVDTNSKPDKRYTPPAPVLTEAQRALLALLTKLQQTSFPNLLDEFMLASEQFILQECNLQNIEPVTRLYLAVCKLTRNLDRMRRMACDTLYFLGDLSVPFLFTVLSTWIEVLPLEQDALDNPLVKVIIQVINLKTCISPGYNLLPVKKLLQGYYGYPTERWNSNDVFKDIFTQFSVAPTKLLEYCLLILCKNHPWKWTCTQIDVHIKPTLKSNCINITSRNTMGSLLRNIIAGVADDINDFSVMDGCC